MKILVLGAGGMAGHVVTTYLREQGYNVDTLTARHALDDKTHLVDVTDKSKLDSFLDKNTYDVVINCIGMLVQQSEERKDLAVYLNSYLPHQLEERYKNSKTKIIHLSTDCVFSGENPPYNEDSMYDGELFYDRSKALGEIKNDKDLTFRMSIIGPDSQEKGIGLFNWFYQQTGEIFGFTKAMWTGVTTIELAKAIDAAIKQNLTGLYHLVPDTNISKFELLNVFKNVFERDDITIGKKDEVKIDKTLINNRADFNYKVLGYEDMIKEMLSWVKNHRDMYKHYQGKGAL